MAKHHKFRDFRLKREVNESPAKFWVDEIEGNEVVEATKSDECYRLYCHIKLKHEVDAQSMTDVGIAKNLGWDAQKVARCRRKLIKANFLLFHKTPKGVVLIVGRELVLGKLARLKAYTDELFESYMESMN